MLGSAKTLNPVPSLLNSSLGLFYTCSTFYEIKLKGLYLHLTFYLAVVRDGSCHDLLLESAQFRLRLGDGRFDFDDYDGWCSFRRRLRLAFVAGHHKVRGLVWNKLPECKILKAELCYQVLAIFSGFGCKLTTELLTLDSISKKEYQKALTSSTLFYYESGRKMIDRKTGTFWLGYLCTVYIYQHINTFTRRLHVDIYMEA